MKYKKRRPYMLMELLVAFSIVGLCVIPLIRTPVNVFKTEIESLEKMALQRIAELSFASIKEQLYKNEISWKALSENGTEEPHFVDKVKISLGKDLNRDYERKFFLWSKKTDSGKNGEEYRLLNTKITFSPLPKPKKKINSLYFSQQFFVAKIPKERSAEAHPDSQKP
jgi:hypothetical protein